MEAYLAAKLRLFENLSADATAVINRDDPFASR
jgi:UDP-N-acetylmuramyl tripeptide synthase